MIQLIGEGSVGENFAAMFTLFINNKLDKLITPKELLLNDDTVFEKLKNCINVNNQYRADIASIIATRLANFTCIYSENNTIDQKINERLINLCTKNYFTNDLKYLIVRTIYNTNKQKFAKLMMNSEIIKMTMQ
jgi:hypothetical protein